MRATITELGLLLTGGRLTIRGSGTVEKAWAAATTDAARLKAAQKVLVMTPEFNTMGRLQPLGTREKTTPQAGKANPLPYKATVLLFMAGGADTFNMLVPFNDEAGEYDENNVSAPCPLYNEYVTARAALALTTAQLLPITTVGQACTKFGLHEQLPFLQELYNNGTLAFFSNVGSLVEPTTKAQFDQNRRCVGLYSHSDQQQASQTLQCQIAGASARGVGGRLGDALAAEDFKTSSFSVAGTSTWSEGFTTSTEIIDRLSGAVRLSEYTNLKSAIDNITGIEHTNIYGEEYTHQFSVAIESSENLGAYLDRATLSTTYAPKSGLAQRLKQVSRLIATKTMRKAERDLFFVTIGGWDSHTNMLAKTSNLFANVNTALEQFVAELQGQNSWEQVVIVSQSDFGRTLTANANAGTDHAWAGNHFVLGGSVKGGRVFNEFPKSLLDGNDQDMGRGRLMPQYPWESMMVPIAKWMGLQDSQHAVAFPNLANFGPSDITDRASLFTN